MNTTDRLNDLDAKQKEKDNQSPEIKKVLEIDPELWTFLDDYKEPLSKVIEDWDVFRAVGESANIPYSVPAELERAVKSLRAEYEAYARAEISGKDLWQSERKGNLWDTLLLLANNADTYTLSDVDRERVNRLLSIIPTKIQALIDAQNQNNKDDETRLMHDLANYFREAIDVITDIFDRGSSGDFVTAKKKR